MRAGRPLFPQIVTCDCGQVKFEAKAKPLVTAVCYCGDCQAAARKMGGLDGIKSFCDPDGGTPYVTLQDKDWVAREGEALLEPITLNPQSPTTRYVTQCCRSPLFLKYARGFWTSTYRARYANPPRLEWRNKVSARRSDLPFPDDIPRYSGFPLKLFLRLIKARFG